MVNNIDQEIVVNPTMLARRAVETYILKNVVIGAPSTLSKELQERAGVFVSIKNCSELRGCIGTIRPIMANIAEEIIRNAVSAASADPRFHKVAADELGELSYSVDVLMPEERVFSLEELDPARYGVIVRRGGSVGLLLPNIEGVNTIEEQIVIACRKAMIPPGSQLELYRFEVRRYQEKE